MNNNTDSTHVNEFLNWLPNATSQGATLDTKDLQMMSLMNYMGYRADYSGHWPETAERRLRAGTGLCPARYAPRKLPFRRSAAIGLLVDFHPELTRVFLREMTHLGIC